jgi:acetyl esterase
MAIPPIDPELLQAQQRSEAIAAEFGPVEGIAGVRARAAAGRVWWNEGGPEMAERRFATIPGPDRDIPAVLYRPTLAGDLPVYVFLHGGGYRIGNERSNDRQMRELAALWGGAVVSIDYAHVPEHVFPHAVEEAQAALRWLHKEGRAWGLDGDRIAFGGSSAGANVATGAAIGLGGVATGYLKAGLTIVGVFDLDTTTGSMQTFGDAGLAPTAAGMATAMADYLPDPSMRDDPRANPSVADPVLFPPMFFAAAEVDTLRDSSCRLADRLATAHVAHELKIYAGMTHLFFGYSRTLTTARRCIGDMAQFLERHMPAS